ncbi:MAG: hypothetical protein IKW53_06060 [Clostridia bacterium]|nr:hypothetical protein [Clostridia bacterium]
MNFINKIKWSLRLLIFNRAARLSFTLLCGVLINSVYVLTNIFSAVVYGSIWAATVSIYHLILIITRIYLLSARRLSGDGEGVDRMLMRVGVLLVLIDLVSVSMMLYTVRRGSFVRYSGFVLFAFLFYSVYSLIISLNAFGKYKNDNNHLHFAAKNISLSTSLMSVFNLQYSILSLLGADSVLTGRAILVGGVVIFSVILCLSLRLIRMANMRPRK